ncbi:MAG: zinc ribbon domain-containing protein [Planctomycetes bacterium]|nr:zinc ribbon domain-containing protein [Planctomycetota bacterium]
MSKCGNCGAENEPAAARCAYCDGALEASSALQVAWLARAAGVQGEGLVDLVAGGGVTAAQVRTAAESAFQSAVDALGAQAKGADVQARMSDQLPGLLPAGVEIRELSMTAYRRGQAGGSATPARPAGPPRSAVAIPLLGVVGGLCCLGMGLLMVVAGQSAAHRLEQVQAAPVVANLAEAKGSAPICLEGKAARGAEPPIEVTLEDGTALRCLYVTGSSTSPVASRTQGKSSERTTRTSSGPTNYRKFVDRFTLDDGTRVRVSTGTNWGGLEQLGTAKVEGKPLKLSGIRAEAPVLTLVGTAHGGELTALEVTTAPTRDGLIQELNETRMVGGVMGFGCAGVGLLLLLACGAALLRKRR